MHILAALYIADICFLSLIKTTMFDEEKKKFINY